MWTRCLAFAAVMSAVASPARADNATPRSVRISVTGTTARIGVSVRLRVEGPERVELPLERPRRAVVTSATVVDASGRHPMVLTRADQAQKAFDTLADAPATPAMATLVHLTESDFELSFHVLSPRAGTLTAELELEAPACIDGDTRHIAIPRTWVAALSKELRGRVVTNTRAKDLFARCDDDADRDFLTWIGVPTPELAQRPGGVARLGVTAARFSDDTTQAARVELAVAGTLDRVPADLHTVFVIDWSRSMSEAQRDAARALLRSYAARAPRTSLQVIGFAREATALLAGWTAAPAAARGADARLRSLVPRNGSELQRGLRAAGRWLQRANGTRRVVILSDERVADRVAALKTPALARELPAGTLVHVVGLWDGGRGFVREDTARWSALAASTEGIAMSGGTGDLDALDALPLVRPISLDHIRITAPGWTLLDGPEAACEDTLEEGRSCMWWATAMATAGDRIDVEGKLWNHRWHQNVALGDRGNLAFARQLRHVLDEESPLAIAALDAARAISSRWSMIARWGGDGGYAEATGGGGTGWGSICGCDGFGTIGHGSGTGTALPELPSLRDQLAAAVGQCARDDAAIALTVETTLDEIVDVGATVTPRTRNGSVRDASSIETCVEEAVWAAEVHMRASHQTSRLSY